MHRPISRHWAMDLHSYAKLLSNTLQMATNKVALERQMYVGFYKRLETIGPTNGRTEAIALPPSLMLCMLWQHTDASCMLHSSTAVVLFRQRSFFIVRAMLCAVYAMALCLCVCLSVTSWYCIETATHRITQTTPHDSTGTLVLNSKFISRDAVAYSSMLFAADLNSLGLTSRREHISRKFFHGITKSTSCIHHLLPDLKLPSHNSRLRPYENFPRH